MMREIVKEDITFQVEESIGTSWGFWDFWASGQWESTTVEETERLLQPNGLLLDIGAWVGPLTLWAAAKIGAKVVAIEPDPLAFNQLVLNIKPYRDLIRCYQVAVTKEAGSFSLNLQKGGDGYSSLNRTMLDSVMVQGRTLISLVEEFDPTLIKIDIEGGESQIFPEAGPYLREHKIPVLLALHPHWYEAGTEEAMGEELSRWNIKDLRNDMYLLT